MQLLHLATGKLRAGTGTSAAGSSRVRRAAHMELLLAVALITSASAAATSQEGAPDEPALPPAASSQEASQVRAVTDPGLRKSTASVTQARGAEARAPGTARARASATLDERVAFYAKELNLDEHQQSRLRELLTEQREQVQRLWADTARPPAERIQATKAIENATSDRISSMLNEEQQKKYNPPRPPHDKLIQAQSTSVEDWMQLTSARQSN